MSITRKSCVLPMARHAISVKNQTNLQPNVVARLKAVGDMSKLLSLIVMTQMNYL